MSSEELKRIAKGWTLSYSPPTPRNLPRQPKHIMYPIAVLQPCDNNHALLILYAQTYAWEWTQWMSKDIITQIADQAFESSIVEDPSRQ